MKFEALRKQRSTIQNQKNEPKLRIFDVNGPSLTLAWSGILRTTLNSIKRPIGKGLLSCPAGPLDHPLPLLSCDVNAVVSEFFWIGLP